MSLSVSDGDGKWRDLSFSHPPKARSKWRPGESRLDKTLLRIVDINDPAFSLVLTKRALSDLIVRLEIEEQEMVDDGE